MPVQFEQPKPQERVLVCGGRDFDDREWVYRILDGIHKAAPIKLLIHGGARGADRLGWDWARQRSVPARAFNADWDHYGKKAGPIRNQRMLDDGKPDLVIAFPGGRGTADMLARTKKAGVSWMACSRQVAVGNSASEPRHPETTSKRGR